MINRFQTLSLWLVITVMGFFTAQLVLSCVLHWYSEALDELHTLEKLVAVAFQSVANRHAGETVRLDLLSPDCYNHPLYHHDVFAILSSLHRRCCKAATVYQGGLAIFAQQPKYAMQIRGAHSCDLRSFCYTIHAI